MGVGGSRRLRAHTGQIFAKRKTVKMGSLPCPASFFSFAEKPTLFGTG